jgi:NRAMP (natural resistance-associated macrophage protein)-like metal ion transporter
VSPTSGARGGPGFLVAAAFIGPGTVTTASVAGATAGSGLIWALILSVLATLLLQEHALRLGVVTRRGLGEALRDRFAGPITRPLMATLVLLAILVGNAAYQGGNLSGAALGMGSLIGLERWIWILLTGAAAAALLWTGRHELVTGVLIGLVALMALVFGATAIMVAPSFGELVGGLVPDFADGNTALVLALFGTTVVPYNLFLHAAASARKDWGQDVAGALRLARRDSTIAILLGGAITLAILITAMPLHAAGQAVGGAADMADQLRPLLGDMAGVAFGVGLAAAGLTSAITAPLAAVWATQGIMGWDEGITSARGRSIWGGVLLTGLAAALFGGSPIELILTAQAANGLLLPVAAGFLVWVMNDAGLLGERRNRLGMNVAAALVLAPVVFLGLRRLAGAMGLV